MGVISDMGWIKMEVIMRGEDGEMKGWERIISVDEGVIG